MSNATSTTPIRTITVSVIDQYVTSYFEEVPRFNNIPFNTNAAQYVLNVYGITNTGNNVFSDQIRINGSTKTRTITKKIIVATICGFISFTH